MSQDAIKMKFRQTDPQHTHITVFESRNGGDSWMMNGELVCDPEIAALFRDVMFRGRGRWDLIVEEIQ